MGDDLTDAQRRVLVAMIAYQREHGISPSLRDLIGALGFASTNSVTGHIVALQRCGYVRMIPRVARGIVLTEKCKLVRL